MKLKAEVDGESHVVEITGDGDKLKARVDGRHYELEISEPEPGVILFKYENHVYEALVSTGNNEGQAHVRLADSEFDIGITDPRRLRGSAADVMHADGFAVIRTAMPGKVVRVISGVGEEVKKGSAVIVVEAMKMQNELRSPKDGIIKEVRVKEGSTVNGGEILLVIE